jgi:hypothetical protein
MILEDMEGVGETRRLPDFTDHFDRNRTDPGKQASPQTLPSQRSNARPELFRLRDFT